MPAFAGAVRASVPAGSGGAFLGMLGGEAAVQRTPEIFCTNPRASSSGFIVGGYEILQPS